MDPQVDANVVAARPCVERRVPFAEVVRVSLIYRGGPFIVAVGWRLGSEPEASDLQLGVKKSPYQVLEVSTSHTPSYHGRYSRAESKVATTARLGSPESRVSRSTRIGDVPNSSLAHSEERHEARFARQTGGFSDRPRCHGNVRVLHGGGLRRRGVHSHNSPSAGPGHHLRRYG